MLRREARAPTNYDLLRKQAPPQPRLRLKPRFHRLPAMTPMTKPEVARKAISEVVVALAADGIAVEGHDGTPRVDPWARKSDGKRVPIQVMGASETGFGIHIRYGEVPDVILVWVWNVASAAPTQIHAMHWPEALGIAKRLGWTSTGSWARLRYYVQTKASDRARAALRPYTMSTGGWRRLVG
jgi:hypothetical protein